MIYINYEKIKEDKKRLINLFESSSSLAQAIIEDGINVASDEIFDIITGRLALSGIYENEAILRTKNSPKYVSDEALSLAKNQANKHQNLVNNCRQGANLTGLKKEKFKIDENGNFIFQGDIDEVLKERNTRKLDKKQIAFAEGLKEFKQALERFNQLLKEAKQSTIDVKIPFTDIVTKEPDLNRILNINYAAIEEDEKNKIQQQKIDLEKRTKQIKRLESLFPGEYPDRNEAILRFMAIDPLGEIYDDEQMRNLIKPSKGTFVNRPSGTITVYE